METECFILSNRGVPIRIDPDEKELLSKFSWRLRGGPRGRTTYAITQNPAVGMHRMITNAPKGMDVDHINRNGLDNRKCNLRICTRSQNKGNIEKPRRPKTVATSKYKGVNYKSHPDFRHKPWRAFIKAIHIGCFKTEAEAAKAYNEKALEHYGEFALLNDLSQ